MTEFSAAQVDEGIEFLILHGAEDRASTVSYSRLFTSVGLPLPRDLHLAGEHAEVTAFMKAIHDRCIERNLPPLDALVVHVEGVRKDLPGQGYFRVNGVPDPRSERVSAEQMMHGIGFWERQVEECRTWGREHRRRSQQD